MEPIGLLDGIATTRAIRRYSNQPVTDEQLATICFAATRAPSGSNRQPFRFVVLRDSDPARRAKAIVGNAARDFWDLKRKNDRYDDGSGTDPDSPKARMARTMDAYVEQFEAAPVLIFPCLIRYRDPSPYEGASVYPAMQNLLLAARAIGLGGVVTSFHAGVVDELKSVLDIPENVFIASCLTLGHPIGGHGPVRRKPLDQLIFEDRWNHSPEWAVDPPGTTHTSWKKGRS